MKQKRAPPNEGALLIVSFLVSDRLLLRVQAEAGEGKDVADVGHGAAVG
jgi:hypothetical protein